MKDNAVTPATTVVARPEHVSRSVGDEAVILADRGMYFGLNPVGARVWGLIQEPRTVAEVCETIMAEYEVDRSACERDVLELVTRLSEERLVELR